MADRWLALLLLFLLALLFWSATDRRVRTPIKLGIAGLTIIVGGIVVYAAVT